MRSGFVLGHRALGIRALLTFSGGRFCPEARAEYSPWTEASERHAHFRGGFLSKGRLMVAQAAFVRNDGYTYQQKEGAIPPPAKAGDPLTC